MTLERAIEILQTYVNNDAEIVERDYVRYALEAAGCSEEEAKELGLGWIFDDDETE